MIGLCCVCIDVTSLTGFWHRGGDFVATNITSLRDLDSTAQIIGSPYVHAFRQNAVRHETLVANDAWARRLNAVGMKQRIERRRTRYAHGDDT